MGPSSARACPGRRGLAAQAERFHGDQDKAKVPDLGEQSVQRRLVGNEPGQIRGAVALLVQREFVEPGRPVVVEVARDLKTVGGGRHRPGERVMRFRPPPSFRLVCDVPPSGDLPGRRDG